MTKPPTETFTDARAFRAAVAGKPAQQRASAREARPALPRAESGVGDRLGALQRLAVFGLWPRYRSGVGFDFWSVAGRTTATCATYHQAVDAAEKETRG